jgi:hypothetical protein
MKITIIAKCPCCQSKNVIKNGKKISSNKQNYLCKHCGRQFIGDHALFYHGCNSLIITEVLKMMVRGVGIRDIAYIKSISIKKCCQHWSQYDLVPKRKHYDCLEVDEFWTYVRNKKNKVWFIYAYHRASGEIVSFVYGKRNYNTAKML